MKILVTANTVGNIGQLQSIVDYSVMYHGVRVLFHLGNSYDDTSFLSTNCMEIFKVPDIWHSSYIEGHAKKTLSFNIDGVDTLIAYDSSDVSREMQTKHSLICIGRCSFRGVSMDYSTVWANPGHLVLSGLNDYPPTYMIISFEKDSFLISHCDLEHKIISSSKYTPVESELLQETLF